MKKTIYKNCPLLEVILQIKFPTILSINSNEPDKFQEKIRTEFPIYSLGIENEQEISFQPMNNGIFPSLTNSQQHKNYSFISEDGGYKINLTSSFISISTINYYSWERLLEKFNKPLEAFVEIYKPSFFERIGLRYIDVFSREKLNLHKEPWKNLINPHLLGNLNVIEEELVVNSSVDFEYFLDNKISRAKIHAGIGKINGEIENSFIIDSDFIHINNEKIDDFERIANYLHLNAKNFLNEAICKKLHNALEPEEKDE